ncbi:MAG: 50S ribosomal protein L15, partial [Opitutaceae bacterium]
SNFKPRPGAKHRRKRVGCGESSGHGKTSGRGHKGQKARSGGSIRLGFEGGQMPLIRRVPKRGFNNAAFKKVWGLVNVGDLEAVESGITIDETFLRDNGFVRGKIHGVKLLGDGEVTKPLRILVKQASASAREKIERAGGTVSLV